MFWLNWDFALVAVAVTPFLLLFVARFKRAVKRRTHEVRLHQSRHHGGGAAGPGVGPRGEGVRRGRISRRSASKEVSRATVDAALKARKVKSLLSPGGDGRRRVVHRIRALAWRGADRRQRDDGRRADRFPRLPEQVLQAGAGSGEDDQLDRADAAVALERIQGILDTDKVVPERAECARAGGAARAKSCSSTSPSPTIRKTPILRDVSFTHRAGSDGGCRRHHRRRQIDRRRLDSALLRRRTPGACSIDGVDVRDYTMHVAAQPDRLRAAGYGVVPRHDPRQHRLRPARRDQDEIVEAAKLANAHEFIVAHAEWLRLAGRRARPHAVRRPAPAHRHRARRSSAKSPILILDEPTAALDTESERLVIEGLERLMKGRTVITIAHRLWTIRDANKIIVLEGRLGGGSKAATTSSWRSTACTPSFTASSTSRLPRDAAARHRHTLN